MKNMNLLRRGVWHTPNERGRRTPFHRLSVLPFVLLSVSILPSCRDFLDVVPDKNMTLESVFVVKAEAYNALAKAYSYLPYDERTSSSWLLGDEWVQPQNLDSQDAAASEYDGIDIMRGGRQNATDPIIGRWRTGAAPNPNPPTVVPNLYEGINMCNLFISRVDGVNDMTTEEIADWKAQAIFLKAYYHFLLLQQYGPVIIMDEETKPDAEPSSLYYARNKVDDCFNYIARTMKEAIPRLSVQKEGVDLGQVTRLAAQSILARVMVWRASPFYSGNEDYRNFNDWDGQPFFPQDNAETTKTKWKEALDEVEEAIRLCETSMVELYRYEKRMLVEDIPYAAKNPRLQTLYDLRWVITDPWNKELIWGNSNSRVKPSNSNYIVGNAQIKLPATGYPIFENNTTLAWNVLGATYKPLERYYTENGLPLDEDISFDRNTMYNIALTPDTTVDKTYLGFLQSSFETVQLYLNREPRFYANLGITGGYWRSFGYRIPTTMYPGQAGASAGGNQRFWTGIGAQKVVHPHSRCSSWSQIVNYPTPIIRLADLYLMKAEARNQWLDAPDEQVWEAVNRVRARAGIPTVQDAWTNHAKNPGKYRNKADMLNIILNERGNEFAFEGHRFWDMLRYRRAVDEFSVPVTGWNLDGMNAQEFFQLNLLQGRVFTLRDCLWPISTTELNKNVKLIQNPGW